MAYNYYGTLAHNKEDNVWEVSFDNFPEAITFGKTPADAYRYGKEALILALDGKTNFPEPAKLKDNVEIDSQKYDEAFQLPFEVSKSEIESSVKHETVKKNTTIPKYLADEAVKQNINFSQTLTEALKEKLQA
ncbi:MAG: type II toxin-antitoxin system HicB family antitoxin [Liquorilactobacillus ghanensis]|uniref:HicB-like antitoxin of toxin-antitoxin system domain-containing protein n=2 Tax=Liquorilactobacillus ghanensis TaxID=399370 RepID=A0A0R1VLI4_9LACO|nr:type II toxin-antitoxin system HicB family antitoxin [Liquorilactobacillus ghanensis]KRM06545.1 hypothetical protein FC89_GL000694 [Liquorilactobacillus ghanensis DSM 18630]